MTTRRTFLDIINTCDNFHIARSFVESTEVAHHSKSNLDAEIPQLIGFALTSSETSPIIGLLRPCVFEQIEAEIQRSKERNEEPLWHIRLQPGTSKPVVGFADWIGEGVEGAEARTKGMKEMCERWRDARVFEGVIGASKWRDELYSIYADPFGPRRDQEIGTDGKPNGNSNCAFEMERAATALFGLVTSGVHMNIYQELDGQIKLWVPKRARTKQTWVFMHL